MSNKWNNRVSRLPVFKQAIALAKNIVIPGCSGFTLFDITRFIWEGSQKGRMITRASAISFKVLLALAPTLILLFSLIPYIPIDNFQANLIKSIEQVLPASTFRLVEGTLTDLVKLKHDTFLSIGFLLGVYYSSNTIMAVFEGFSGSYYIEHKINPFKSRVISIILVFLLPFLIIPAFLTITLSETILGFLLEKRVLKEGFELALVLLSKWVTVIIFFNLAISILYHIGSPKRKGWRFVSPGSVLATLAFVIVSQGFAYYVNNFGNYNKFYGSLGTIVVLLVWVHFNSIILLVGYELNASIFKANKALVQPEIPNLTS
jgi:membrane protein